MSSGVVTFDVAAFVARYPQFAAYNTANPGALQLFFNEATLLLKNAPNSLVRDLVERTMLLNMITAHLGLLAGILAPGGAGSTSGQVGRVSSATEGSVSATLDMGAVYASQAWWLQTQMGASYWQMTAKYRTMRAVYPRGCRC